MLVLEANSFPTPGGLGTGEFLLSLRLPRVKLLDIFILTSRVYCTPVKLDTSKIIELPTEF